MEQLFTDETIAELDSMLRTRTDVDFDTVVRWLHSQDTKVPTAVCRVLVANVLAYHWQATTVELVAAARSTKSASWAQVASACGYETATAAARHFRRASGDYPGYSPVLRYRPRSRPMVRSLDG